MKCSPELLEVVKECIEGIQYGSVTVVINEKGRYTEITTERKYRVFKQEDEAPFICG
jgi:hypothetical protein